MALWGKNDSELKAWEEELHKRENEFSIKEATLNEKEERLNKEQETVIKKSNEQALKESDLITRELDAKNGFSVQHEKSFSEKIRSQLDELENRQKELTTSEEIFTQRLEVVLKRESEVTERERTVKEKELEAETGFASKNNISLRVLEERESDIKNLEDALEKKEQDLNERTQKLNKKEQELEESEKERDNGYRKERDIFLDELKEEKKHFHEELQVKENKKLLQLDEDFADKLKNEKIKIAEDKEKVEKEKLLLLDKEEEIEYDKQRLNAKEERLKKREENLNKEIEEGIEERKISFDNDLETVKNEANRLRESIASTQSILSTLDELKRKLGDEDPEIILKKLNTQIEEIKELKAELIKRPTSEMIETFDALKKEKERFEEALNRLSEENNQLKKSQMEVDRQEMDIEELKQKNTSLENLFESVSADNNRLTEDLKRIQASYEREADREDRINDIRLPYFEKILPRSNNNINELAMLNIEEDRTFTEIEWLENIRQSCEDYGLNFSKRILYAFHTALKTSEWSPLTVLAGVSGTGKSELPRLYSHFGGINFLSLAVQPNWDSKESILGFFNSINNSFDAEPVLRLLAQSQEESTQEYPEGLKDTMSLVLLDEMNLAYVELYFAEFLSKLELRRGKKGDNVPSLEIKLGAGVPSLDLPLGRNVLWTGTMNQDETTKSLSDKVLDRGMVLHFPRPTSFERRKKLKPLPEQAPLLDRKLWESWWVRESKFTDDQINPFKDFMETINNYLAVAGRALGHRVWQSIEYYIANHPEVQKALKDKDDNKISKTMKEAFEDQLVLKVMPKLRGIETRGRSKTECLDKIRHLLDEKNYSIVEDFDIACETGYGQFMWNSAKYLEKVDTDLDIFVKKEDNFEREDSVDNFIARAKVMDIDIKSAITQCLCKIEKGSFGNKDLVSIIRNGEEISSGKIKKIGIIIKGKIEPIEKVDNTNEGVLILLDNELKVEKNDIIVIR